LLVYEPSTPYSNQACSKEWQISAINYDKLSAIVTRDVLAKQQSTDCTFFRVRSDIITIRWCWFDLIRSIGMRGQSALRELFPGKRPSASRHF